MGSEEAVRVQPRGTVTFLFTDIEGSTRRWDAHPDQMRGALERHDALLGAAVARHGGTIFKHTGDGMCAVFDAAEAAVAAALELQTALGSEVFPAALDGIRVRAAVHTGTASERDGDYFGPTLNRVARLMGAAHGAQVLVSEATSALVAGAMPSSAGLLDLGQHRLRDLERPEQVFQLTHETLRVDFPPLRAAPLRVGSIPEELTSFVGRGDELAAVAEALDEARLVTLTGVGGVGKTRLALQTARRRRGSYPDGVWVCELAGLGDGDELAGHVSGVLDLQQRVGQSVEDSLLDYLTGSGPLLLVLDNCEHLLGPVADLVTAVLRSSGDVTVLATSREGLGVPGERLVSVPSLGLPVAPTASSGLAPDPEVLLEAPAVALFVGRARDVRSDFALTAENAAEVAQLCARLDGIPLALELAAARVRSLGLSDLVRRLDDRFRVLTGGRRGSVERHQTLRSTIDWSYDLLDPAEQALFARLCVFAGTFDLTAAESVCAGDDVDELEVMDLLGALADKSMVQVDESWTETRYSILESLRQYAAERLEERGEVRAKVDRHTLHYGAVAETIRVGLRGADEAWWVRRARFELDNLRAAAVSALTGAQFDQLGLLVGALAEYAVWRELPEVFSWAEASLDLDGVTEHPAYSLLSAAASWGRWLGGDLEGAEDFALRSIEWSRSRGVDGHWLANLTMSGVSLRDLDLGMGTRQLERIARTGRAAGDLHQYAYGRSVEITALTTLGLLDLARPLAEELAELTGGADNPTLVAVATSMSGIVCEASDVDQALALVSEAYELAVSVDNSWIATTALASLGLLRTLRGDAAEALVLFPEIIDRLDRSANRQHLWAAVNHLTFVLGRCGRDERAAELLGMTERHAHEATHRFLRLDVAEQFGEVEERLGPDRYSAALARGAAIPAAEIRRHVRQVIEDAIGELNPPS